MKTRKGLLTEAVARGWCSEKNSSKTMDSDLAMAIVDEIMAMPCEQKLDIEREMSQLYDSSLVDCTNLDILVALHKIRLELRDKEGATT